VRALASALLLVSLAAGAEDRVAAARASKSKAIQQLFETAKVAYPPGEILLRAFKEERELELWAGPRGRPLTRIKTYPICAESGTLGPKRQEGDEQIPEGFYAVNRFNPWSNFHLALGLDYPNASDRILGARGRLGGDIMIHGNCVTVGCIPIQNDPIEEVYLVAVDAQANGQARIPVHIFPARLDEAGMKALSARPGVIPPLLAFWRSLQPGYQLFEKTRRPPLVTVDPHNGEYRVAREP
jgi:murein L,D-transpeptidase YafK